MNVRTGLLAAVAGLSLAGAAVGAPAARVSEAWVRATPLGATTAAAYLTVTNTGHAPLRLVSASSPAAAEVVPHQMSMAGGVMRMRPIVGGVSIPPGGAARLTPNGDHLMLTGLKRPLKAGERVAITLDFAPGGPLRVSLPVADSAPADAAPSMAGMRGMSMP